MDCLWGEWNPHSHACDGPPPPSILTFPHSQKSETPDSLPYPPWTPSQKGGAIQKHSRVRGSGMCSLNPHGRNQSECMQEKNPAQKGKKVPTHTETGRMSNTKPAVPLVGVKEWKQTALTKTPNFDRKKPGWIKKLFLRRSNRKC